MWTLAHDMDGDFAIYDQDSRLVAITDKDSDWDAANAHLIAAGPALMEALQELLNLTDQGREGGLILSRADRNPITNGDQDVIDRAYIAAETAIRLAKEGK